MQLLIAFVLKHLVLFCNIVTLYMYNVRDIWMQVNQSLTDQKIITIIWLDLFSY